MNNEWSSVIVTSISVAVYVPPNSGKRIHKNRPFHGLVLNDETSVKEYCFSDGRVMVTEPLDFFYLPKGSSYIVKTIHVGGCYAINFDAVLQDDPFSVKIRNAQGIRRSFKQACDAWRTQTDVRYTAAMRALYDGIFQMQCDAAEEYMSGEQDRLILPALALLERDFTDPDLRVETLAAACGISAVYLRKIFAHRFGVSPKEYLIQKRLEYARQLLALGELSVQETANLCGYKEVCHFSREFKKHFGVSPAEW